MFAGEYVIDANAMKATVFDERYGWCCIADRFGGKVCLTPKQKNVCRFTSEAKFLDHHQRVHKICLMRKLPKRATRPSYDMVDDGHTGISPVFQVKCSTDSPPRNATNVDQMAGAWAVMGHEERHQSMVTRARATRSQTPVEEID